MESGITGPGSRFGWRGALVLPSEYFDAPAGYSITLDSGIYSLSGTAATLTFNRATSVAAGSYSVSGQPVALTLTVPLGLSLDSGAYGVSGQSVAFDYSGGELLGGSAHGRASRSRDVAGLKNLRMMEPKAEKGRFSIPEPPQKKIRKVVKAYAATKPEPDPVELDLRQIILEAIVEAQARYAAAQTIMEAQRQLEAQQAVEMMLADVARRQAEDDEAAQVLLAWLLTEA